MDGWVGSSLRDLCVLRNCKRKRVSSWDKTGGNADYIPAIPKGKRAVLADIKGAGVVSHIWLTISCPGDRHHLRKIVLRMYWDGEKDPSVETPVGDFFGIGHATTKNFWSAPLAMSPDGGRALNCYFPMPFSGRARIELTNECDTKIGAVCYYIDYEEHAAIPDNLGRFHAWWHRENPTKAVPTGKLGWRKPNLDGKENYLILDAKGKGHYVGCTMSVDCEKRGWYGEGDDMIFVDGEKWPPSLHGTGTEDYFNTAWCPNQEYTSPYHGLPLVQNPDYSGKTTLYRFHIEDPVMFDESIRVTIEHGHANDHSHDCSSVAYWYQTEPHRKFPKFPSAKERVPWPL